jgi:hypothetical protein
MKKFLLTALLLPGLAFSQQGTIEECKIALPIDLSAGNAAVAKMRDECIPKIRRIAECTSRTRLLSESVSGFISKFKRPAADAPLLVVASSGIQNFELKNSDLNIWRNFLSLETQYNQSLDAVKALADKYRSVQTASSSSSMRAQLDSLDFDYNATSKTLARLSENEYKLMIFIENIKRDLEETYERTKDEALWLTGEACKDAQTVADIKGAVKQLEGAFVLFTEDANAIYEHMQSAKAARQNLINYTYTAIRSKIEDAYSARLVDELSTLGGKIDIILRANRLSARFENWYSWSAFEPNRDKILTVYQQFEGARQILAADLISAQNFRDQMLALTEPFPDTGSFYLNRMNSVIEDLETSLARLETKGWKGYLSSQKATSNRIAANPAKLTPACLAAHNSFLSQAAEIDSLEKYRLSEKVFLNAVVTCTRKPT